jgi:hypothetical protein
LPRGESSANRKLCWSLPYITVALVEQAILGDLSSRDHVWGHRIGRSSKCLEHPRCAPQQRCQSDSKNVSNVSFAWKRRNGVPTGKIFANALSFTARFACKYRFLVSMLSRVPAQRNYGDVDARLKQGYGCAMSNDVRRNAFLLNGSGSSRIPGNAIARSGCLLSVLDGEREFQDGRTRCR